MQFDTAFVLIASGINPNPYIKPNLKNLIVTIIKQNLVFVILQIVLELRPRFSLLNIVKIQLVYS